MVEQSHRWLDRPEEGTQDYIPGPDMVHVFLQGSHTRSYEEEE